MKDLAVSAEDEIDGVDEQAHERARRAHADDERTGTVARVLRIPAQLEAIRPKPVEDAVADLQLFAAHERLPVSLNVQDHRRPDGKVVAVLLFGLVLPPVEDARVDQLGAWRSTLDDSPIAWRT